MSSSADAAARAAHLRLVQPAEQHPSARALIDEGGVSLGESAVERGEYDVPLERADGALLRVGKRRFRRLRAG